MTITESINRGNVIVDMREECNMEAFITTLYNAREFIAEATDFDDYEVWPAMLLNWPDNCTFNMEPAVEWLESLINEAMDVVKVDGPDVYRELAEVRLVYQLESMDKNVSWKWTQPDWR